MNGVPQTEANFIWDPMSLWFLKNFFGTSNYSSKISPEKEFLNLPQNFWW